MSAPTWLLIGLCTLLVAIFAGSETGFYSLSPLRVEARARAGSRASRLILALMRDEASLLVTVLIGTNLMLEIVAHLFESQIEQWSAVPAAAREVVLAGILTPFVFFFGELLPKDLFRRRPHRLVRLVVPIIALARVLFLPLALPLRLLVAALERLTGLHEHDLGARVGHQAVLELLAEGARKGTVEPHAERLARNVLALRGIQVEQVMVPWAEVERLDASAPEDQLFDILARSKYSRLPVADASGAVLGYVHQLDVLGEQSAGARSASGRGANGGPPPGLLARHERRLVALAPDLSVDRALVRLRTTGQRAALVGSPEAPLGWVTLKDLVEEISGDLAGW